MPFIKQQKRKKIAERKLTVFEPGDRCYVVYKELMDAWRANPRWATADALYGQILAHKGDKDWKRAADLAWQGFFALEGGPYERNGRRKNGNV